MGDVRDLKGGLQINHYDHSFTVALLAVWPVDVLELLYHPHPFAVDVFGRAQDRFRVALTAFVDSKSRWKSGEYGWSCIRRASILTVEPEQLERPAEALAVPVPLSTLVGKGATPSRIGSGGRKHDRSSREHSGYRDRARKLFKIHYLYLPCMNFGAQKFWNRQIVKTFHRHGCRRHHHGGS